MPVTVGIAILKFTCTALQRIRGVGYRLTTLVPQHELVVELLWRLISLRLLTTNPGPKSLPYHLFDIEILKQVRLRVDETGIFLTFTDAQVVIERRLLAIEVALQPWSIWSDIP